MLALDPIVAPATAPGTSALAVIRLSGAGCHEVLFRVARPVGGAPWGVGRLRRVRFVRDDVCIDDGMAVLFRGPATATGEDTAELTCHGNPLIVDQLVAACVDAGARLALPGELTRRAVTHGKLDLLGAVGVRQAIEATSLDGLAVARMALDGALGAAIHDLRAPLLDVAAELEARLDYPDDELALVGDEVLAAALARVASEARRLADTWRDGHVAVHGARVALIGPVNAGKSSLFNALVGRPRALVHDRPGTTRDVLELPLTLDGVQVTLLDTAGERATDDPIEAAGLALARELLAEVDLVIVVLRARPGGPTDVEREILARTSEQRRLIVVNGVDLAPGHGAPAGAIPTSAVTGEGIATLRSALRDAVLPPSRGAHARIASLQQRDLLLAVARLADDATHALPDAGVAVAADLVTAAVSEIDALTGADTREAVLDALFARFCIGK